jgi:hypothetical protein
MNNPDHISERLETFFGLKILEFFDANPGSGMENIWIRDPVSGINIPDPQHWSYVAGSSITLILSDIVVDLHGYEIRGSVLYGTFFISGLVQQSTCKMT